MTKNWHAVSAQRDLQNKKYNVASDDWKLQVGSSYQNTGREVDITQRIIMNTLPTVMGANTIVRFTSCQSV